MFAAKHGAAGLSADRLKLNLKGSAGQSLGAWNVPGLSIRIVGDANDYVGKGMSGGRIVLQSSLSDQSPRPAAM